MLGLAFRGDCFIPAAFFMLNICFAQDDAAAALILPVARGSIPDVFRAQADADGFSAQPDTMCDLLGGPRRVLLVSMGADRLAAQRAGAVAVSALLRERTVTADLRGISAERGAAFLEGACLRAWRTDAFRTRAPDDAPRLDTLHILSDDPALPRAWACRRAAVTGTLFARDLVTEPSNTLTPAGFIDRLETLRAVGVAVTILRGEALREAGLTGLLAVGGGSVHAPALAVLHWPGITAARKVIFVGKGITFDTGGISIKPADGMWEMRADMAGAAGCAGAMLALALRQSAAPAMAVLALAENTTSEFAYRPSDVLRHADGTTIEIVDTDAEGRLVLADALGWAVQQNPAAIIDLATLTGSVVTALGHYRAGLFGNDDALAAAVAAAGEICGEPVWRLPIGGTHREALDSDIADLRHCVPERGQPDASQAAAFLRHFVAGTPWAHLDIAGVENREEADDAHCAGATGFGVRLLDQLVADRFEDAEKA
jgi:leucyl aminopeptidase